MAGMEWFGTDRFGDATELSFEDHLSRLIVEALARKAASGALRNPTIRVPIAEHMLGLLPVDLAELRARLERAVARGWRGSPLGRVRVLCETMTPGRTAIEVLEPGDRDAVATASLGRRFPRAAPAARPESRAVHSLVVVATGARIPLPERGITLGRAVPAPGRLRDELAGRRHCHVLPTRSGVRCVDLRSTNGTWVDGRRIDGSADLVAGQVIRIGSTEFAVDGPPRSQCEPS